MPFSTLGRVHNCATLSSVATNNTGCSISAWMSYWQSHTSTNTHADPHTATKAHFCFIVPLALCRIDSCQLMLPGLPLSKQILRHEFSIASQAWPPTRRRRSCRVSGVTPPAVGSNFGVDGESSTGLDGMSRCRRWRSCYRRLMQRLLEPAPRCTVSAQCA